jgi:hypothetical protein
MRYPIFSFGWKNIIPFLYHKTHSTHIKEITSYSFILINSRIRTKNQILRKIHFIKTLNDQHIGFGIAGLNVYRILTRINILFTLLAGIN